jgi:predicted CXXCH cytochrome family protein
VKSRAGRWFLSLSVLAVLIGCRAFGVAKAAGQEDRADAPEVKPILPPLPVPTAAQPSPASDETGVPAIGAAPQAGQPAPPVARPAPPPPPQVAKPTESIPTDGCVTSECHPGIKARPFTHGPVEADSCDACHEEADASQHSFELTESGAELCESCHELELEEQNVHQPVGDGQCDQCHDPHGGSDRSLMRGDNLAETCGECHDDVTEDMPFVHGPAAAGACTACHRGHGSDHEQLLTHEGPDLCVDCHTTLKQRLDETRVVHGPAETDCTSCHLPHAAEGKMMLRDESADLCLECHSDIQDAVDEATVKHDAVTSGKACRSCHDPHGSDHAAILFDDAFQVCLSCHGREIELADKTRLMGMQDVLVEGANLHGPVAQRNCIACHDVHGGSNFRLLIEEYPAAFYAPYDEENYGLCFSCHESEVVRDAKTTRLTNFRNGSANMHYLHVNRKVKGRTCRACHETHASKNPKHIRDAVPFGSSGWKLPIRFEKTETGGRCSPGCHRPYDYDRLKPAVNVPPQEGAAAPGASIAEQDRQKG